MRQGLSSAAMVAVIAVTIICTGGLFAASTELAGPAAATVTYTTTVVETSSGQASTILVPTTVTDTTTSTSSPAASVSTVTQTSQNLVTETTTVTTVQTFTETMNTTTAANSTATSSATAMFEFAVGYSVANYTDCQPDPGMQCTWSGTISWPGTSCNYTYACNDIVVAPDQGNESFPISLGECSVAVNWQLSMTTPADESQLSVTITNPQGVVVYETSTAPSARTILSSSYQPC